MNAVENSHEKSLNNGMAGQSSSLLKMNSSFEADSIECQLNVEELMVLRFTSSLLSKRFLIATGLAGSGKTKLAQAFTRWLVPPNTFMDPFVPGTRIQSDRVAYVVKKADSLAVEFWNSDDEDDAIKVTLPRAMIKEWADYISEHALTKETPARRIREAVKNTSRFSDQLHSFETHLKAAAFASLDLGYPSPAKCYQITAVGADWIGNENILGYPNGLDNTAYITKPALDLILHAAANPDVPHILILDEMNLSHVERYFADILSAIESDEKIHLHGDSKREANGTAIPPEIELPKNLFIIGTVNVDETTYMFSPKVLDRANVIEFRMETSELEAFLSNPGKPDLSRLDAKGAGFGQAFVEAARGAANVPADAQAPFESEMSLFFQAMQPHGAEFGYRVAHEAARFVYFYKLLGNYTDDEDWFSSAFDCVVVQKFLPKLHGSRARLGPLLKSLWFLCVNDTLARGDDALQAAAQAGRSTDKKAEPSEDIPAGAPYPLSAEKIARMWRLLRDNGFASFAEA